MNALLVNFLFVLVCYLINKIVIPSGDSQGDFSNMVLGNDEFQIKLNHFHANQIDFRS